MRQRCGIIGFVSAIAIVSVAAVCAGYLCFEGYQIRRLAFERARARARTTGPRSHASSSEAATRTLERCLLVAVQAADTVWAYNERLFVRGPAGESPFRLRRARVDRAQQRFVQACGALSTTAERWLASDPERGHEDPRAALAVQRVHESLCAQEIPRHWHAYDQAQLDAVVDLAENALSNLRRDEAQVEHHPFR